MKISLGDLFPMLRSAKGSAVNFSSARHWERVIPRRKPCTHKRAAAPRASAISFETFEPRVLLSADSVVGGFSDTLSQGLNAVGTEIGELIENDPLFDKLVPGIVTTLEIGENVYQVSPTLGDALSISADVFASSDVPGGPAAGSTLAERWVFIDNLLGNEGNVSDEFALRAMDIDGDGSVQWEEAFKVAVIGQLQNSLANPLTDYDLDDDGTVTGGEFASVIRGKILNLDTVFGNDALAIWLQDRVILDVDSVTASFKNDTLTWDINFSLTLLQRDTFSLGYEAENLGIALDPANPPELPNNDPFGLSVSRTVEFGSLIVGVKNVSGGVTASDFFFAIPDKVSDPNDGMRVGVNIGSPGSPASLLGLDVNVGFLGADVINTNDDGLVLDMDVLGSAKDPSSAAALGFTEAQLGAINAGGTVEAANDVNLSALTSSPVQFTLKVGTAAAGAETEITLASGTYNTTADVVAALNAAIAVQGLDGIVTASDEDGDDQIEFTVVASNPAPLGFEAETGAVAQISGNPSALVGLTAAQLSGGLEASFLLILTNSTTGVATARVVNVNVTTFSNPGADPDVADDDLTTIADIRAALLAGVNAAFGVDAIGVTVNGSNVVMAPGGGSTIEISRKLTVDTLEQITLAELGTGDVLEVDADANAAFDVYMLLKAKAGLKDGNDDDYRPEGTIKVDIDPFDPNDVKEAKIDEDPQPPTTDIVVASFVLTDKDGVTLKSGNSDLQLLLDFNVVSVADILGTFTQIANWFERVTGTEQLLGFDLPFLETSIGEILNLKDLITDTFLLDDGDDGVKAPGEVNGDIDDVAKLLKWVTVNGQQQLRSLFSSAQQLEVKLNELLSPFDVDARVIVDGENRQNLVYHLSVADVGIDVDSQQAGDQPLIVPLDFDLNLGPIGGFVTEGKLSITAEGTVGFDLGIILGNAVDVLDIDDPDSTEVQTLNSDSGVRINTNQALTTLGVIEPLVGRLSGDAVFRVTMAGGTNPGTYEVTVPKTATVTNTTLAHLLTDLNTALQSARTVNADGTLGGTVDISGQIVVAAEPIQDPIKSVRLVFRAADAGITRFQIQTSTTNPSYTELGLQTQSAFTVSMVGSEPVSDTSPGVAVEFDLVVKKGPLTTTLTTVTLPTTGEFGTNDNFSLQSLLNDLNGVLTAANTGILASQSGGRLVLSAVDAAITGFTLKGADALGFNVTAANLALTALGVTETPNDGVDDIMVAGAVYRAGAGPQDPFGRLGIDVAFTINGEDVSVSIADTANNADVEDLARSLNAAIEINLKGKVAAVVESGRLTLRAIDSEVADITVAGLGANESAALGFADGSSIGDLYVRSTTNAPVSYGVSADTEFTVTINNGDPYTATLLRDNTILNRSLYDLAASINNAINVAVGGANKNPLIATVQGGQIVIGIRTSAAGTGLVGDAYDPDAVLPVPAPNDYVVKPSDVTGFSINSTNSTFVNELKLLTAVNTEREASTADFVIYFADGTSASISLDALDPDKNQAIDEVDDGDDLTDDAVTLAQVVAAIYSQVTAQLPARTTGPGNQFEIKVALNGTSLQLFDRAGGSNLFRVAAVNGAPTAANLGILASDTSNNNINEVSATTAVRDGIIDGARIATIDFADRVWLDNVGASGAFEIETQGEVSAEATFGFAGIRAFSSSNQTLFSAEIDLPLFNGQQSLRELFDIFAKDGGAGVAGLIGDPTLTLAGDFSFKVEVLPGLSIDGFDMPENDATVVFKSDTVEIKLSDITGLGAGALLDKITIEANNFDDLINFDQIKFDNVLDAVLAIADFLTQFEAFGFMDDDIPVLGVSVKDMLGVADEFLAAVNEFRDNPAGGIQQLSQKILESLGLPNFANAGERDAFFNNLGIPVPAGLNQLIEFAFDEINGNKVLRFDLRFPIAFSEALNVDLDLGQILPDLGPVDIDIQGGAGLAASGYLDARLSFGIDLDDPTKLLIYDDVTGVFGELSAGANNVQFNAAIGPIGAFVKDGRVNLGLDFNVTGDDGTSGPSELGDFLNNLQASLTGSAEATLPIYFPSDSEYLGDIVFEAGLTLDGSEGLGVTINSFTLPEFADIDLSAIDPFASIPLMLDALDFFLMGLQDTLDGEVFDIELPLIGKQLQGAVDFIEDMRRDLLAPLRQYIEQAPDLAEDVIEALLYELLADSAAQGMVNGQNIEDFLGIGGDIAGLGLLGDLNGIDGITQDDVDTIGDGNDGYQWIFELGDSYQLDVPLEFDLGIPAIALEMNTALQFTLEWGLTFGVGISKQDGAYIYVGDDSELEITVAVDVPNQSLMDPAAIRGELGFLQLEVWEDGGNAEGLENESRGTYLQAQFTVDLLEAGATGADADRVSFSELGSLDVDVSLTAEAEVNLFLKAAFNDSIVPDTIAAFLPSISGRFILDWETGNVLSDDFDFANSLDILGFRDVKVDMGSFISDLLGPFVEKIAEVTGPLQPIIEVITAPIPVISDLAGQSISLVDIAGMTGYVEPAMIYAIADIITLVNKIGDASDFGEFNIPLGDFILLDKSLGTAGTDAGLLSGADLLSDGYSLASDPKFDGDPLTGGNLDNFLTSMRGAIGQADLGSFDSLLVSGSGDADSQDLVGDLKSGESGGGFAFPIFDNPSLLFGLLLGKDVPLLTYDLAPFGMDFSYVQKFPIWDALFIRIGGSASLTIDLAFGYDTRGARDFADGGFTNPLDLLAGLYVSDTNQPSGEGVDVPELVLRGELFAGAELNLGVASAGAEGVIGLVTNFDLYDPDGDGRVRINELVGNFLYEFKYGNPALAPIAIFDVYGQIYAQLRAFVEALFFEIEFEITPPITLFEFSIPFERQPFLATERGDGSLLLNIGPNAAQRLNGDTRDIGEEFHVKSLSDTEVLVWGMGISESDGQKYQLKAGQGIYAYGGDGNDIIDLSGVTHAIPYFIEGGAGDDMIVGGQSGGTISGESGNDKLDGGSGVDVIFGGEGNDTIDGQDGDDIIFGDTGSVTVLDGGVTRFRSITSDSDGDDKLYGGDGRDIILGAGGIDWIEGGIGDDIVLGDGGNFDLLNGQLQRLNGRFDVSARGDGAKDTILGNGGNDALFGGAGDDLIDGGADDDEIEAGEGFDVVYGGSGADTIYGGTQNDIIFGFRDLLGAVFSTPGFDQSGDATDADETLDGVDTIFGEDGNDYIRGNRDNDVIRGGAGADIIFGDEGDDQIFGEAGGDIMFGGADDDTIDGSDGADIAFGDDGLIVYIDFDAAKADFDFTGSRIRYFGGDQMIGDADKALIGGYENSDDGIETSMDLIVTKPLGSDGSDTIIGGEANDILFGGGGLLDTLFGDFDPTAGFNGPRPTGQDVMIGDGGRVELTGRRNERIAAESNTLDGIDHMSGNDGGDYMFGGGASDVMQGFEAPGFGNQPLPDVADNDVMLGDNGEILLDTSDAKNRIKIIRTTYVAGDSGRSDQMFGTWGNDVMFGGLNGSMDVIEGGVGQDILLGDQGAIYFVDDPATAGETEGDSNLDTLDLIRSFRDGLGAEDEVSGGEGADVVIGGTAGDVMYGDNATASGGSNDGDDIMLGDNADIWLIGTTGRLPVQVAAMPAPTAVDLITTTDDSDLYGGADTMSGNAGNDVMFGGVNNGGTDKLYGDRAAPNAITIVNDGDDIMVGDNGLLDFTFGADTSRMTLDLIRSFEDGLGGKDELSGGKGQDVGIGGTNDDTIFGDDAIFSAGAADVGDILLGDNADLYLVALGGAAGADLKTVLGSAIDYLLTTDEENPSYGGVDTISGNAGGDIIAGGVQGDFLWGDREMPTPASSLLDGNDIMLGDNARLEWRSTGRFGDSTGLAAFILANNPDLHAWFAGGADTDLGTLDLITTAQSLSGARDRMWGDEGSDLMFGGTDTDLMYGDDGDENYETGQANQDVMFGDHGRVYPQFSSQAGILSRNFFAIDMGAADGGQGDVMYGEEGDDVMLGQQGDDRMWGGKDDDDMIGGHNRPGGYDELAAGAIDAQLPAILGNEIADGMNDLMDGGSGDDAMAGDNAVIWRRGDDMSPRFRALTATATSIYTTTETAINANIGGALQSDPEDAVGRDIELLDHSDDVQANPLGRFGQDVMAGGADDDVMFGQLGDDLMQGDGNIGADDGIAGSITRRIDVTDSGSNPDTDATLYFNIPEVPATDGDDYMEGNGGRDLMYGGMGQDDMIGGSSALFGLTTEEQRPDDSDTMFGGAGIDIARNHIGDATQDASNVITPAANGNGLDADYMMGDNANVYRLVSGSADDAFLRFNYDSGYAIRIIPRAMQQLDYSLGGADYNDGTYTADGQAQLTGQPADNGAADLIHGESGDDVIFGMTGSDVLFGDGQDDDIIGGYGHDWISGGTGQDGILGDDGLVLTSRNSTLGEPLNGIAPLLDRDPDTKYSNGNVLDEVISTPGSIQTAVINKSGELKKTIDLVPFSYDSDWLGTDDEYPDNMGDSPFADDIIFGGLGSDFLHGGSGDDAISGAEALGAAFVPTYDDNGVADGVYDLGYAAVGVANALIDNPTHTNPGNVLAYNKEDTDGQHLNNRFRAGEFRLYDEYDPRREILLTATGELSKDGTGVQFLLNFAEDEGVIRPAGTIPKSTGQSASSYLAVNDDGDDKIFGDLGNDWLVGGTGRDNAYGGWGNDLMNVDDTHATNSGLNDQPDTHPTYEDRAYGGAGRDVLIGNTGGDRLIDWVGEYNSYLVPYAPFGQASVSRTLQPFLPEFLYALSEGDGADATRASYTGDPRNGEPNGELGLVLQKDQAWQDQTGAPADPQAGNIPGGKRDVLRSADFSGNQAQGFVPESGSWTVKNGRYEIAPLYSSGTSDAISLFNADVVLPSYFEIAATINAVKPTAGFKANAYVIFDYVSPTNFKFAGVNVSTNKFEIGQRTANGWQVLTSLNVLGRADTDYNVLIAVNGNTVTAVLNGKQSLSYAFQPRMDADGFTYLIRDGMIGLGGDNARARIDNVRVQVIPPAITYAVSDAFDGAASTLLSGASGNWALQGGRYVGAPAAGAPFAVTGSDLAVSANAFLQLNTVVRTAAMGGVVFDMYSPTDFKWAAVSVTTQQVLIGHYTAKGGWVVDAAVSRSLTAGTDYALGVSLKGPTVSVTVNGQAVLSRVFNSTVVDGAVGTFARGGSASFDSFGFATDDPRFAAAAASASSTSTATTSSTKTTADMTSYLSTTKTSTGVGAAKSWQIDWNAKLSAKRAGGESLAKSRAHAWQEDFVLNLGGRTVQNPNEGLRVLL